MLSISSALQSKFDEQLPYPALLVKTLKTCRGWVKHFQTFTSSKTPAELSPDNVKASLSFLAVKRKVSSTTQNQAFIRSFLLSSCLGQEIRKG
jgi:hypothetical protein